MRLLVSILAVAGFGAASAAGIVSAQVVKTLDLTQPAAAAGAEAPAVNGVVVGRSEVVASGTAGGSQPPLDLRVVLKIDQPGYQWGDPFYYELEITNTSKETLLVPWSRDIDPAVSDEIARQGRYRSLSLALGVSIAGRKVLLLESAERVAGFLSQPETVKSIEPGETFLVKGRGRFALMSSDMAETGLSGRLPGSFRLEATVSLSDRPTFTGASVRSAPVRVLLQPAPAKD